jgi:cytochrome P450
VAVAERVATSGSPVEFDPLSSVFFDDPYAVYARLREEAPAYHNETYGFWALSRFSDVVSAHRDWQTFSSTRGVDVLTLISGTPPAPPVSMIMMDPPEHDHMRVLVSRVFTPRAVSALEPMVRTVIGSFLDELGERETFDAVADFSGPFPIEIISRMLGVPEADRQPLRHLMDEMLHREPGVLATTTEMSRAALEWGARMYEIVVDKRQHPADDMLSRLCEVEVEREDGGTSRLDDVEITGFAGLLVGAGAETVTKLVGNAVVLFARHPDEWRKVVEDRARIPSAVEEILRYWPPSQYQGRFSARPSTWHDLVIPAGSPVLLLTGAATRDGREFVEPDRFDIDRPPSVTIGLGHGIHSCLGAALARMESRIALEEWVARWPNYDVDEDGLRRVHMTNVAGYANVPVGVSRLSTSQ